jgi:TPR repeat protein
VALTDAEGATEDEALSPQGEAVAPDPRIDACIVDPLPDECVEVIRGLAHGGTQPLAPALARRLAEARCDREQPASCTLWVESVLALGQVDAITDALGTLRSACDAGDAPACALSGEVYRTGFGVPEDRARALRDYATACEADHRQACATQRSMQITDARRDAHRASRTAR